MPIEAHHPQPSQAGSSRRQSADAALVDKTLIGLNLRADQKAMVATACEDIVALLGAEGVLLTPEFVRLLKDRRRELRESWEKVLPNRVGRWAAAGWYDRPEPPTLVRIR